MTNKYQQLADLEGLRKNGTITEEEYQRERARLMNSDPTSSSDLGMEENTYLMLMHLSQFSGFIIPFLGHVAPIIMWAINKDKNENVNMHGKNIINFMISWLLYYVVAAFLCFILIGIPILILLCILNVIFIILAAVRANGNEYWAYPMTIPFFRI